MKKLIKKYSPPGLDLFPEIYALVASNLIALLGLVGPFPSSFNYYKTEWIKEVPEMPLFSEIITESDIGFPISAAIMICFVIYRYVYLAKTKSIYLTKRLPVWRVTEKLCLIVPVCYALFCIILWKLTLIIMFIFYYVLTPEIYLNQNAVYDFIMENLL